jgi:epoxyqueuosine reductase
MMAPLPKTTTAATREAVFLRCRDLGFALAGVCRAEPTSYREDYLRWISAGRHGEMGYLARNVEARLDPRVLVPGAKSIICVGDRYWVEGAGTKAGRHEGTKDAPSPPTPLPEGDGSRRGRVARYARGEDYHSVMKKRLRALCDDLRAHYPEHTFRACVDTAPVLEREHAQRAGLGAVGKNTLLIRRGEGSYFLLGEIITTLEIPPSEPSAPDPCGSCTRCINACPTGAIAREGWSVDATKCISYLTIEHRGEIDPQYHEAMGDWIFGCDICQEVCPHNQPTERSSRAEIQPAYSPRRDSFNLLDVLGWSEDDRRRAFARSSMKRAKLHMMKRNAAIAAANNNCHH